MHPKQGLFGPIVGLAAVLAACGPADGVAVEPLPPLERPAAEARAGVPVVGGDWRFAGWEVATAGIAAELGAVSSPGDLRLQAQRIDSLAGFWVRGDATFPVVGEVRRDGVVALVSPVAEAPGRFAAGRFDNDTLWIELATMPAGEVSPPTVRWAFVRGAVGQAFMRLPTGESLRDTVVAEPVQPQAPQPAAPAEPAPDAGATPPAPPEPQPPATPRTGPPATADPQPAPAQPARPPAADTSRQVPPPAPTIDTPHSID